MKCYIHMLTVFMVLLLGGCQNKIYVSSDDSSAIETIQSTAADPISIQNTELEPSGQTQASQEESETSVQAQNVTQAETSKSLLQNDKKTKKTVNYRYLNGIECHIETVDTIDVEAAYLETLRIDGLRDIQVQQKINDRIKQAVLELYHKDYPPYRGIKRLLEGNESDEPLGSVHVYVYYNEANLLSIGLLRSFFINNNYCTEEIPLTFDLNTGRELSLADLFYDGCDYQNAIVEYVRSGLNKNRIYDKYSSFTLLKPFETVNGNQKFYISSFNTITLIIDYETPEFDLERMRSSTLDIQAQYLPESGAELVFDEKYETWDEHLYRSEQDLFKRRKLLKSSGTPEEKTWTSDNLKAVFYTDVLKNVDNEKLADMISAIAGQEENRLAQIIQEEQIKTEQYDVIYYWFNTSWYGDYLNIMESYTFWGEIDKSGINSKVYHTATGQQLELSDIFVPGVDYQTILTNAAHQDINYFEEYAEEDTEVNISMYFNNLQFMIYSDKLELMTPDNEIDWYVAYEEIGEENLVLFH